MVLLYAPRAAIFNPYPSCLSHKLCNHGLLDGNRRLPLSRRVVFMLYLKQKSQLFSLDLFPSDLFLFSFCFYLKQKCQIPSFSSILPFLPLGRDSYISLAVSSLLLLVCLQHSAFLRALSLLTCWGFVGKIMIN